MDLRRVTTARLRLDAVVPADLDEHHALPSGPRTWEHLPSGRHTSREPMAAGIGASVRHRAADGPGHRSARLRDDVGDLPAGRFGGCARRGGTRWWNRPLLEHDSASRRRAERAGPTLARRGPDAGDPDPAAVRLVPADRPLDDDLLAAVTALA